MRKRLPYWYQHINSIKACAIAFVVSLTFIGSTFYSSEGHAYALADAVLLKFYGGVGDTNHANENFSNVSGTPRAFGRPNTERVLAVGTDYDTGLLYGIAIEYFFVDHWSIELAWEQHSNDVSDATIYTRVGDDPAQQINLANDDGVFEHTLYAFNIYYNFGAVRKSRVQPYLGIGYLFSDESILEVNDIEFERDGHNGIQYIVALALNVTHAWNVFFEYRNIALDDVNYRNNTAGTITSLAYDTEMLLVGFSFQF